MFSVENSRVPNHMQLRGKGKGASVFNKVPRHEDV
jgi:hypothetical protein